MSYHDSGSGLEGGRGSVGVLSSAGDTPAFLADSIFLMSRLYLDTAAAYTFSRSVRIAATSSSCEVPLAAQELRRVVLGEEPLVGVWDNFDALATGVVRGTVVVLGDVDGVQSPCPS